jgi:hypothetical protein
MFSAAGVDFANLFITCTNYTGGEQPRLRTNHINRPHAPQCGCFIFVHTQKFKIRTVNTTSGYPLCTLFCSYFKSLLFFNRVVILRFGNYFYSFKMEWVLTTANGTNGLTYLPKHGGARDNKFWSPIL